MQSVAQALVAELVRPRLLVQAAVLELAQMQAQRLVQVPELELALGLQLEREPPVVRVPELVLARAAAPEPRQVRELRVSRQQEQQHRLQAAVQELPPYLPALPMKAPY